MQKEASLKRGKSVRAEDRAVHDFCKRTFIKHQGRYSDPSSLGPKPTVVIATYGCIASSLVKRLKQVLLVGMTTLCAWLTGAPSLWTKLRRSGRGMLAPRHCGRQKTVGTSWRRPQQGHAIAFFNCVSSPSYLS